MPSRGSWHAWTESEWEDKVAPPDEQLGRFDQDVETLLRDVRDAVQTVMECTVEPLRGFAQSFPRSMGYDASDWQGAWRRSARHNWRRWSRR